MHREYLKDLENKNQNIFELSLIVERFKLDLYIHDGCGFDFTLPSKVAATYAAHVQRKPAWL
jgi:hypothetical protein